MAALAELLQRMQRDESRVRDQALQTDLVHDPDSDTATARSAMLRIQHKLNIDIGFGWWKRYIAAAFWSNMSMPLNLAITLLTALTTAQATTDALLNHSTYVGISIATLILTVLNSFFRPHAQMTDSIKLMSRWMEFGNKLESIYYSTSDAEDATDSTDAYTVKQRAYEALQAEINAFENSMSPESHNFLTDMIHVVARLTVLNARDKWLDLDMSAQNA
jgi:hypothetical protein